MDTKKLKEDIDAMLANKVGNNHLDLGDTDEIDKYKFEIKISHPDGMYEIYDVTKKQIKYSEFFKDGTKRVHVFTK